MLSFKHLTKSDIEAAKISGHDVFAPEIHDIVNGTVKSLVRRNAIPEHMADDISIELYLKLLTDAPKFNPEKCDFLNYARMVIRRHAISFVRHYSSEKRIPVVSLDAPIDEFGNTLADIIADTILVEDVNFQDNPARSAMSEMPDELRDACDALIDTGSIRGAAAACGMSHSRFRRNYVDPVRKFLAWYGIGRRRA